jgi:hypothetical protein
MPAISDTWRDAACSQHPVHWYPRLPRMKPLPPRNTVHVLKASIKWAAESDLEV